MPRPPPRTNTPRLPAPPSLSPTWDSLSRSMSSKRYSAGSQKRRRGRTTLVRSWLSALDNQLTEGRAILILCTASERNQQETEHAVSITHASTYKGSRFLKQYNINKWHWP